MQRTILSIAVGLIFNISAVPAWALNLGKGVLGSTLGQPLNFSVNVNSEPEEGITSECVSAEVYAGDNKLAPAAVRISSEGGASPSQFTVRVSTNSPIDEPVVTVAVGLGCPARVTRRFVLFVDPPLVTSNAEVAPDGGFRPVPQEPATALPKPISRSASRSARDGSHPASNAPTRKVAPVDTEPQTISRPQRRNIAPVAVPEGKSVPKAAVQRPPALAKAAAPAASAPRLKLDSAPRVVAAPLPSASSASSASLLAEALAAKAVADAASASSATSALQEAELRAARRVAALEESLQKLKAEAQASRKSLETLQATVREADARKTSSGLLWALGALSAALAAAVAALLWLQARRRRNPSWWTGGSPEAHLSHSSLGSQSSPSPETRSSRTKAGAAEPGFGDSSFSASKRDSFSVVSGPVPLTSAVASINAAPKSSVVAVSALAAGFGASTAAVGGGVKSKPSEDFSALGSSRELSVEELIDLEQQADFFVVLGQDEAAIDLLMTHVRSTGGLSPMPYMKLLEIYRRLGNHDAYERIRERFNQRFNGDVPAADVNPDEGRDITDYPDTLSELIAVWPTPFKAVDTLGRWLARSDSDAPGGTLAFDLPAYSQLLFLHSLARDLSAREPSAGGIDVLLPLAMEQASPITSLEATNNSTLSAELPNLMTDSGYDLDLDLSLPMPLQLPVSAAAANTKQTDYDNAGPKSDFMSLNIDSRFQG